MEHAQHCNNERNKSALAVYAILSIRDVSSLSTNYVSLALAAI